jgi:hypothetical protein
MKQEKNGHMYIYATFKNDQEEVPKRADHSIRTLFKRRVVCIYARHNKCLVKDQSVFL